eukprot:scaffold18931_cov62-Attheya_sp.AAC.3
MEAIEIFLHGLELWKDLSAFMNIVKIDNEEWYVGELTRFETNLKEFYECGRKTFLTKNVDGDDEFFFLTSCDFIYQDMRKRFLQNKVLALGYLRCRGMSTTAKSRKTH